MNIIYTFPFFKGSLEADPRSIRNYILKQIYHLPIQNRDTTIEHLNSLSNGFYMGKDSLTNEPCKIFVSNGIQKEAKNLLEFFQSSEL